MLDQELLTLAEVAKSLGVSEQTVRRWFQAGDMPRPLRFGRRLIRWPKSQIDEFLAGGTIRNPKVEEIETCPQ